jgi:hypothetical protein
MDLFKKILSPASAKSESNFYSLAVKCDRCGEIIAGRINLANDLTPEYAEAGDVYFIRKVLIGNNKCFQRIEVELKFNTAKQLMEKQASGGQFV